MIDLSRARYEAGSAAIPVTAGQHPEREWRIRKDRDLGPILIDWAFLFLFS